MRDAFWIGVGFVIAAIVGAIDRWMHRRLNSGVARPEYSAWWSGFIYGAVTIGILMATAMLVMLNVE